MKYERDSILNGLKTTVCEITFTKVNGQNRVMRATLDPRYMPPITDDQRTHLEEQHSRKENKDVIACWDVVVGGWRSFRVDSVQYVQEVNTQ